MEKIVKTDEEWQSLLTPEEYRVLRKKGTESPYTGEYVNTKEAGTYVCRGCGEDLFTASAKFDSGCGWPSFYETVDLDKVDTQLDLSANMRRIEVTCKRCGGHLGHVFRDAPQTPTGMRYCINSISLKFHPKQ